MNLIQKPMSAMLACLATVVMATPVHAQAKGEIFTGTAAVPTATGGVSETPMAFTLDRKMPAGETSALLAALQTGGAAGLRKALAGVAPAGSVHIGAAKPTPARIIFDRGNGKSRLITIVTDQPLAIVGVNPAGAKPRDGYDFAVIELVLDGAGTGTVAPAAKVTVTQGVVAVADSATAAIRLTGLKKVR